MRQIRSHSACTLAGKKPSAASSSRASAPACLSPAWVQEAGFAVVELMRRSRHRIEPMALVEAYAAALRGGDDALEVLWSKYGAATGDAIADGCRVLAMLWDSAWSEGYGHATNDNLLGAVCADELIALYTDQLFVPSLPLDEIGRILRLGIL